MSTLLIAFGIVKVHRRILILSLSNPLYGEARTHRGAIGEIALLRPREEKIANVCTDHLAF